MDFMPSLRLDVDRGISMPSFVRLVPTDLGISIPSFVRVEPIAPCTVAVAGSGHCRSPACSDDCDWLTALRAPPEVAADSVQYGTSTPNFVRRDDTDVTVAPVGGSSPLCRSGRPKLGSNGRVAADDRAPGWLSLMRLLLLDVLFPEDVVVG